MEDLLTALARDEDADALVRAIEESASRFAAREGDGSDLRALASGLARHAEHPRAKVRQAVAEVALYLPGEMFERLIGRLLKDSNAYVKRAAVRSYDERSRRERMVRECEHRSATILRVRTEIGETYGRKALRLADQAADRALTEFVSRLYHEVGKLGTPLRRAAVELKVEADRVHGGHSRLAALAGESRQLVELLLAMVASAHAQARAVDPVFRDVSVGSLIESQLALLLGRVAETRRARISADLAVAPALSVEADPILLGQAISNLLQNAVEAYPVEGAGPIHLRIQGELRKEGALTAILIADRGSGIAPADVPRIGEPFLSTKGEGRGLGFLNVKRMVEVVHGGSVELESELGVGTRVLVVLPRKQPTRGGGLRP